MLLRSVYYRLLNRIWAYPARSIRDTRPQVRDFESQGIPDIVKHELRRVLKVAGSPKAELCVSVLEASKDATIEVPKHDFY